MWRESLEQIPRMWRDEPYSYEGKYFRMPERNVLPEAVLEAEPADVARVREPGTFPECGELGLGSLCFTLGRPADIEPHVKAYKAGIARCTNPVGGFVNDNIAVTTNICLPDGDEARWLLSRGATERYAELFFQWLDSIRACRACRRRARIRCRRRRRRR